MPRRKVILTENQHELVEGLVQSGRYQNASDVLRHGLRLIEVRARVEQAKLEALKQAARQGWVDYLDHAVRRCGGRSAGRLHRAVGASFCIEGELCR